MAIEGGGTLSEVYQAARKLLLRARDGIERLEKFESTSVATSDAPELSFAVKKDISQIEIICTEMERLLRSVLSKPQRDLWKRKVEQVTEEAASLRESLNRHTQRKQRRTQEIQERAELLGRANGESSHVLRIFDEEAQAMQSVNSSKKMLEDSLLTGAAILSKYSEQRERLKMAQRKTLDVLNTVGLSGSVLRLIERRNRIDRKIKYCGMVITLIVIYYIVKWRR